LLAVAMATVVTVGVHYWHRADVVPDGKGIGAQPVPASEIRANAIAPVVPVVMESVTAATPAVASQPVSTTAAAPAIPAEDNLPRAVAAEAESLPGIAAGAGSLPANSAVGGSVRAVPQGDTSMRSRGSSAGAEATHGAAVLRPGAPVPAAKPSSAHERSPAKRRASPAAVPPVARGTVATRVRSRVGHAGKGHRPDRWHVMYASLASCDGDLIDRIVCNQRIRLRFCEGYWGEVPQCGGGVTREQRQ
jgi:hypothetical protein